MEAVEAKKASFAGISGSCTADLTVTKNWWLESCVSASSISQRYML